MGTPPAYRVLELIKATPHVTQVVVQEENEALTRQVQRLAGERDTVRDELDMSRSQLQQLASAEAVAKQEAVAAQSQLVTNEDSAHEHAAKLIELQRALAQVHSLCQHAQPSRGWRGGAHHLASRCGCLQAKETHARETQLAQDDVEQMSGMLDVCRAQMDELRRANDEAGQRNQELEKVGAVIFDVAACAGRARTRGANGHRLSHVVHCAQELNLREGREVDLERDLRAACDDVEVCPPPRAAQATGAAVVAHCRSSGGRGTRAAGDGRVRAPAATLCGSGGRQRPSAWQGGGAGGGGAACGWKCFDCVSA